MSKTISPKATHLLEKNQRNNKAKKSIKATQKIEDITLNLKDAKKKNKKKKTPLVELNDRASFLKYF